MSKIMFILGVIGVFLGGYTVQAQSSVTSQISALRNSVKSFAEATNTRVSAVETKLAKMEACSNERKVYDGENDVCFTVGSSAKSKVALKVTEPSTFVFKMPDTKDYFFNVKSIASTSSCTFSSGGKTYKLAGKLSDATVEGISSTGLSGTCSYSEDKHKTISSSAATYTFYLSEDGTLYNVYKKSDIDGAVLADEPTYESLGTGFNGIVTCATGAHRYTCDDRSRSYPHDYDVNAYQFQDMSF